MKNLEEALKSNNLTIGTKTTLRKLRENKVRHIFLASNCDEKIKKDIDSLAGINNVEVVQLDVDNIELGTLCKKPFVVTVLSY
ncbi:MAG: ribosomal L7Ae/L30e/S12e/Gadd45 family protein [Candidatus Nanoarchaeia archaeon]|nr:ribosomal L7Ae/L30e/S12e/Gadd45 family protein [Candidatus Nanoarchaeia archaeon]